MYGLMLFNTHNESMDNTLRMCVVWGWVLVWVGVWVHCLVAGEGRVGGVAVSTLAEPVRLDSVLPLLECHLYVSVSVRCVTMIPQRSAEFQSEQGQ